jgi:hypothetical protein
MTNGPPDTNPDKGIVSNFDEGADVKSTKYRALSVAIVIDRQFDPTEKTLLFLRAESDIVRMFLGKSVICPQAIAPEFAAAAHEAMRL